MDDIYGEGDVLQVVDCPFMMGTTGTVQSVLRGDGDVCYSIKTAIGEVVVFHNEVIRIAGADPVPVDSWLHE
jgi:hypothetical protein